MQTKYVKLEDVIAILKANIQFNQQKKMKLEKAARKVTGESLSTITDRLILDTTIKQDEALMNLFLDKLNVYDPNGEIADEKSIEENNCGIY